MLIWGGCSQQQVAKGLPSKKQKTGCQSKQRGQWSPKCGKIHPVRKQDKLDFAECIEADNQVVCLWCKFSVKASKPTFRLQHSRTELKTEGSRTRSRSTQPRRVAFAGCPRERISTVATGIDERESQQAGRDNDKIIATKRVSPTAQLSVCV